MVKRPKKKRIVALPSSLFSELHEPARTLHIGFLARALAIFRVEEIVIFEHEDHDPSYLVQILSYLNTPQYLRKRLYSYSPALKYVGLLPPLAIPSHPRKKDKPKFREGLVISTARGNLYVDAGLEEPVIVEGSGKVGDRVIIKRTNEGWILVDRKDVPVYWGYDVRVRTSLRDVLMDLSSREVMVIATSRRGRDIRAVMDGLRDDLEKAKSVALIYGMWSKGLFEIAKEEGFKLEKHVDYVINFIPNQGTRTVRTEEAVMISLSVINLLVE